MRVDGGSAYDKKEDEKRKWKYRYTMITIIFALLVVAGAIIGFQANPRWFAEDNRIDVTRDRTEYPNQVIGGGGIDVVQPVPTVDSKDTPAPSKSGSESKTGGILPVNGGKVSLGYSGNELVYSKTLDQYVVHRGIDYAAPADSQVVAVAGGTVTKVYNDDKLGVTIEITHKDGYVTRYCSLSTDKMVEEGDVVEAGQVISGVGNTALFESLDGPHLHFEVWQNGNPIDPAGFLKN